MSTAIQTVKPVSDTPSKPAASVASGSRGGLRILLLFAVAAIVGLGAWQLLQGLGSGVTGDTGMAYVVERRSFPVIEEVKGELKAAKTTEIKSKVEGRATIIWLIEEGQTVEEGETLVKLASDKIEERVRQEEVNQASAEAAFEAAEKDLEILKDENASNIRKAELALRMADIDQKKYVEGDAEKKLLDLQLDLAKAEQSKKRALLDYDAAVKLREREFITESELLQNEFSLHEARRSIEKAEIALRIFNKYEKPKDLERLQSDIDEANKELARVQKSASAKEAQKHADVEAKKAMLLNANTQLSKYREQLGYCEIKAPTPGLVVYHTGHRWDPQKITEGGEVHERQTIVNLPDPSVMLVSVRIHEAKTHKIVMGQHVNIEIDAIPGRMFTGKISKMAPLADSRNSWLNPDLKEYETEITLDQAESALKPGVTARAEIIITLDNVVSVPLQAIYAKSGHKFVFRDDGRDGEPIEVEVGQTSSEFAEITSGLNVGENILLAVTDAAKSKLPELEPDPDSNASAGASSGQSQSKGGRKGGGGRGRGGRRSSRGAS